MTIKHILILTILLFSQTAYPEEIRLNGFSIGSVEQNGDVRLYGRVRGRFEPGGDLNVGGSIDGRIESDGTIRRNNQIVGQVLSNGDVIVKGILKLSLGITKEQAAVIFFFDIF